MFVENGIYQTLNYLSGGQDVNRYFQIELNALRPYSSRALKARFADLLKKQLA